MTKILFLTDNFPPETNAPATRTYEHCREWVKKGAEVTVITSAPNFPKGELYAGYKNRIYQREEIDGIHVIRVWSYITANRGAFKRIIDYMSFAFSAFWVGIFQKHDIIVATSPQFFTTWAAVGISKICKKPWIFELRDIWPASIRTVEGLKQNKILDWLEKVELWLYRDASLVIGVTHAFKRNLIARGIEASKIRVITNGANHDLFTPREKKQVLLKRLGLEGKFIVAYIGTLGMAHSLPFILESIARVKENTIHFLFIGEGAMKSRLITQAQRLGLKNITFLDQIKKVRCLSTLA